MMAQLGWRKGDISLNAAIGPIIFNYSAGNALTMPMMAPNLALLFVFRFPSVQFPFWYR